MKHMTNCYIAYYCFKLSSLLLSVRLSNIFGAQLRSAVVRRQSADRHADPLFCLEHSDTFNWQLN